jgi:hypothetical protein
LFWSLTWCLAGARFREPGRAQLDLWWRTTVGFCKIDEKWMVTHEHNSVPFAVESGKSSLGFKA